MTTNMEYRNQAENVDLDESTNDDMFSPKTTSSPNTKPNFSAPLLRPSQLLINTTQPPPFIRANPADLQHHDDDNDAATSTFKTDLDDIITQISRLRTDTSAPTTPVLFPPPLKKNTEPRYLSSQEQFLKQQNDEVKKTKQTVKLLTSFSEVMAQQANASQDKGYLTLARNLLAESQT